MKNKIFLVCIILCTLGLGFGLWSIFVGFKDSYIPKPRAYIYIELPEKQYTLFDSAAYPFSFDLPTYSSFNAVRDSTWADIEIPSLGATINLSYIPNINIDSAIKNSMFFVSHNMSKANGLYETEIYRPQDRVFGNIIELSGSDVASSCQFYVNDSLNRFVRGALYINCVPNNDSLAPVLDFLKEDIRQIAKSFRWTR